MESQFWLSRWTNNEIGFHLDDVNPLLVRHIAALGRSVGERLLLPLCGKSRDIAWLLEQGFQVVGVELSALAVEQLFAELNLEPVVSKRVGLIHYQTPDLDIWCGDIFNVDVSLLGRVDAIYDRAALVALPQEMRTRYAAHLRAVSAAAPQLLICFEYDQALQAGPPFSVDAEEIQRLYGEFYALRCLEKTEVQGGLKGLCPAQESVWLLSS